MIYMSMKTPRGRRQVLLRAWQLPRKLLVCACYFCFCCIGFRLPCDERRLKRDRIDETCLSLASIVFRLSLSREDAALPLLPVQASELWIHPHNHGIGTDTGGHGNAAPSRSRRAKARTPLFLWLRSWVIKFACYRNIREDKSIKLNLSSETR